MVLVESDRHFIMSFLVCRFSYVVHDLPLRVDFNVSICGSDRRKLLAALLYSVCVLSIVV